MMSIQHKLTTTMLYLSPIFVSTLAQANKDNTLALPYASRYAPIYSASNTDESITRVNIYANILYGHPHGANRHPSHQQAYHQQPSTLGLCDDTAKKCWKATLNKAKSIPSAATGNATVLADIMLPNAKISRIYAKQHNQKWSDVLTLTTPLQVEAEFRLGHKMLISLNSNQAHANDKDILDNAGIGYIGSDTDDIVYYNPKVSTFNRLGDGISLRMPAKASVGALVITLRLHDVGDPLPLVDIMPEINLLQPAMLYYLKPEEHAKPTLYYSQLTKLGLVKSSAFQVWTGSTKTITQHSNYR